MRAVYALALAFASSVSWGVADFLGGLKARKLPLLNVLLCSQGTGLVLVGIYMLIRRDAAPGGDFALFAVLSGVAGAIGLASFYRGLAVGNMGVVAPISSTAAVIPVVVGIASGDRPSAIQYAGLVLALVGVVLASREEVSGATASGAGFAMLSALGFGFFFVGMDNASDADIGWAMLGNRITSFSLLLAAFLVLRPAWKATRADAPVLATVGTLDITANGLFAIASTEGLVSLVSVLGSLYPLTTVALAAVVLGERPHRIAQVGVAVALTGVGLIAAG
jgi:drug/metabolite transporter (DMT)-like permease